jgi:phosphoglycerol transferase MdoB-like AlkP superfamily enzyme
MNPQFRRLLNSISPPRTVLFFLAVFLLAVILLTLFRFGFLLKYRSLTAGIPFFTLLHSLFIGIRFDIVVLSFVLIPLFILSCLPPIGIDRLKASRVAVQIILFTALSLIFFLSLVDIEYYGEFGTRLSHWTFEYLDQPDMVWYAMWSGYPMVFYLLLWGGIVFLFSFIVAKIGGKLFRYRRKEKLIPRLVYFILVLSFLFLGARGRWQLAPIDWGLAYFSPYGFANQLALNGTYTLGKSYWENYRQKRGKSLKRFNFFSETEALSTVQELVAVSNDSLADSLNSLARWYYPESESTATKDYNVVIILLESWLSRYVGALGGEVAVTPNFDSLAQQGILFENFFATGTRTNRGMVSILCSFPSQPYRTIMKQFSANHPFISLPTLLKKRGYRSVVVYGGDLQFDNMEGFLRGQGVERFVGEYHFPSKVRLGKWGVPDHVIFDRANQEFTKLGSQPFLGIILTLSNHEPFLLPSGEFKKYSEDIPHSEYLNTFYYSDWALGEFFRQAEKQDYFKNTIFVLVSDHGKFMESQSDFPWDRFHIACLIYAPHILGTSPRRVSTVASQTDLVPTILGLLGKPTLHESWGRDILSLPPEDSGFAMMLDGDIIGWLEGSYFLVERIGATSSFYNIYGDPLQRHDLFLQQSELASELRTKERSFLQLSIEMMKKSRSKTQQP